MLKWEVQQPRGVIVIVHGAGEHQGRYRWVAERWNAAGFHVITGDLPGQGKTRGKRGHIKSFTQYIDTIVSWYTEASKYELPVFLLGHSMGGLASIRTMMKKQLPFHGVILSSPCLKLKKPPTPVKRWAAKTLHYVLPELQAKSGIQTHNVTRNEQIREEYLKDELRVTKVSLRWYQELTKAMQLSHQEVGKFPEVPILVMQAGDDYIVDKEATRQWFNALQLEDKSYKEWKGLYHEIFNEPERERVFEYAKSFVELHL
ncbi:alpha/beta hydrolase [Bacillus alkalicellulosilyticus]|uniref:alpha/beta hydrolase n=1 Tax=Alkalihalobacterium alkalicellulosilyticum TaxID=1912214 RepID=UPI000996BF20|nr:alpha/beta hydrolase [Bacillus alkalicellulosilyticus]